MENLTNIKTVRSLLERHGFRFSKALGQNFIINPSVCPRIAELGGSEPGVGVLEIGPGIGVLTAELAKRCDKVVAIELDNRLPPLLSETLVDFDNVEIIHGDVLKLNLKELIAEHFQGLEVVVCANLPYYITSPVIMALLEEKLPLRSITVMVQKEAAQRICAPLPSRQAGAITVSVNYYCEPQMLFTVSKGSFMPAPEVESAVIRLDIRREPPFPVADETLFFRVVRGAFSQRRKTLLNCLSSAFSVDKAAMAQVLEAAGVPPSTRAEQLALEDFGKICGELARIII